MEPDYNNPALRLSLLFSGASASAGKSPDEMAPEELDRYLAIHGVNLSKAHPVFDRLRARLSKKESLRAAASRRAGIISAASATGEAAAALLARAQAAVDALMQRDPGGAQVYARKFEAADEDDLATLLDDMLKIEFMEGEDVSRTTENREGH